MLVFLTNLSRLFLKLELCMDLPEYVNPDFRTEKVTKHSLELHYRSQRPIPTFIEGICLEVGEMLFNVQVKFKLLRGRHDGTCDHDVCYVPFMKLISTIILQEGYIIIIIKSCQ